MKIKSLKFYLELGGNAVYNLNDLENNFYFQEIVSYYRAGIFLRWLRALGENEKADMLERKVSHNEKDKYLIVENILDILDFTATPETKQSMKRILTYEQVNKGSELIGDPKVIEQTILDSYFERYEETKGQVRNTDDDSVEIEVLAKTLAQEFLTATTINFSNILEEFILDKKNFCSFLFNELQKTPQNKSTTINSVKFLQSTCVDHYAKHGTVNHDTYQTNLYNLLFHKKSRGVSDSNFMDNLDHLAIKNCKGEDCLSLIGKEILIVDYCYCNITINGCEKLGCGIADTTKENHKYLQGEVTHLEKISAILNPKVYYVEL